MTAVKTNKLRFDWAVVRLVPSVHREEFHNAGVLLHVPTERLLLVRLLDSEQLTLRGVGETAKAQLRNLEAIARGEAGAGAIAAMSTTERFHWLTAPRSAVIQTSPVRIGLTLQPQKTLDELFDEQCC